MNERFSKLQGCLQSRRVKKKMMFPPFGNEILSPSINIILKFHPIIYLLKQKEIVDYNPKCFMSSGLMFDDIFINIISNKALKYHHKGVDSLFKNIANKIIYMYRGSLQDFYWKKGTYECLDDVCVHSIETEGYL